MSTNRQLPLLPGHPATVDDLNRQTPLQATVALFQEHLRKEGKSDHTIKAFTSDLLLLADYSDGTTPIGHYTTTLLNEFLHWMEHERGVPCSRKTYARRVTTLKVYFKWLHELGAITSDPAKAVLQRSGPAPLPVILSPTEVRHAIMGARMMTRGEVLDTRPELLFRLLLNTGIKKNETMRLTPSDIDRSNPSMPILTVRYKVRNVFKERRVKLDPDWLGLFDAYMAQYRPDGTIFNCTARNLEYILADIGEQAGIPVKISFEMLRWTSAVLDYREGVDPEAIREKLGLSPTSWHETFNKIKQLTARQLAQESGGH
ncbi:MAG: hypothetical protein D6737_13975 [Chloroflexi bacterium]|nr:MAG: hypothetical protein D6737_13975 [Chloroflexota bacterium]